MEKKSERMYWDAAASSEKFDYYICGLIATVVAFIFRDLGSNVLSVSPYGLKLASVVALLAGVVFGLKRLEQLNVLKWLQHGRIYDEESLEGLCKIGPLEWARNSATGEVLPPAVRLRKEQAARIRLKEWKVAESKAKGAAKAWYKRRNRAFIFGVFGLVVAKVWAGYSPYLAR